MKTLEDEAERARALVAKALPRIKRPDVLEYATTYLVTGTGVWPSPESEHWTTLDSLVWDIVYYLQGDLRMGPKGYALSADLNHLEKLLSDAPCP